MRLLFLRLLLVVMLVAPGLATLPSPELPMTWSSSPGQVSVNTGESVRAAAPIDEAGKKAWMRDVREGSMSRGLSEKSDL